MQLYIVIKDDVFKVKQSLSNNWFNMAVKYASLAGIYGLQYELRDAPSMTPEDRCDIYCGGRERYGHNCELEINA